MAGLYTVRVHEKKIVILTETDMDEVPGDTAALHTR